MLLLNVCGRGLLLTEGRGGLFKNIAQDIRVVVGCLPFCPNDIMDISPKYLKFGVL